MNLHGGHGKHGDKKTPKGSASLPTPVFAWKSPLLIAGLHKVLKSPSIAGTNGAATCDPG